MDNKQLTDRTDFLSSQISGFMAENNLVKLLEQFGEVKFVGAYPLQVMYNTDIDILILAPNPSRDQAYKLTEELLKVNVFQALEFYNWYDYQQDYGKQQAEKNIFPDQNDPFKIQYGFVLKGFYWKLSWMLKSEDWKADIWFMRSEDNYSLGHTIKFKELLNRYPEKRLDILKLKSKYSDGKNNYRYDLNGFKIDKAVLEMGANCDTELENFFNKV